jgi:uncharacterized protein YjbI with pentapeptide repeats/uncharacterized RDD family membrane protein YckC
MANPSYQRGKQRVKKKSNQTFGKKIPLLPRRLGAWTVEVYLLAASAIVPYSIGTYIDSTSAEKVALNPVLADVEMAIAQTLGFPRRQVQAQVAPATNLLWWIALSSPVALTGWQLYLLGKTGQTLPKRWFGVRVIADTGRAPNLLRVMLREGVGKWGLPLGTAYLLWRYLGGFPNLILLVGIGGVLVAIEAGMLLVPARRRPFHDELVKTVVVDAKTAYRRPRSPVSESVTVEVEPYQNRPIIEDDAIAARFVPSQKEKSQQKLWMWMRQHPSTTLLISTLTGMTFVMMTFVATQVYIQDKADWRQAEADKNEAFLMLIDELKATSTDPLEERKSVILAIARLEDPRAVPLLVDLLGQETNPSLMNALEGAIESTGLKALPALKQLNQSLSNQLQSLSVENAADERRVIAMRLKATKGAIAQLLVLANGRLNNTSLQRSDLGAMVTESGDFSLVLDRVDLSGMNLRSANLYQASFKGSIFNNGGEDRHLGTFDDAIADLSGADLREANLADAFLSYAPLKGVNLMQATLNRANLFRAQLNTANLSSAQLLETNLTEANLEKASLTGADLTEAAFVGANLRQVKAGRVEALRANFSSANLFLSSWMGADLSEVNFIKANLQKADLSFTQLTGANLQKAQLQNANFANANLSNADLRGANLAGADFQNVIFVSIANNSEQILSEQPVSERKINLTGVDFTEVKNLSDTQINFICQNGGYHPQCSLKK